MSEFLTEIIVMKEWIENDIQAIKSTLERRQEHIALLNKFINTYCNHCWETDYIDLGVDKSKIIKYCKLCHLTKP